MTNDYKTKMEETEKAIFCWAIGSDCIWWRSKWWEGLVGLLHGGITLLSQTSNPTWSEHQLEKPIARPTWLQLMMCLANPGQGSPRHECTSVNLNRPPPSAFQESLDWPPHFLLHDEKKLLFNRHFFLRTDQAKAYHPESVNDICDPLGCGKIWNRTRWVIGNPDGVDLQDQLATLATPSSLAATSSQSNQSIKPHFQHERWRKKDHGKHPKIDGHANHTQCQRGQEKKGITCRRPHCPKKTKRVTRYSWTNFQDFKKSKMQK